MPWQLNGTFERILPDYPASPDGVLWGQDLTATVKIIASRHDFHDQDIGDGIAACLNLDGLNAMRANLDMGQYKIVNGLEGTATNDFALYGQCANELAYVPGTGLLQLFDVNGDEITQVTLTPGTGGAGTITSITTDDTLESSPDVIQVSGSIGLKALDQPGQSYTGGIQGVVIDDYGRVTQVTIGSTANTNLSNSQGITNTTIYSSTGTGTVILEATSSYSGVMSVAQVQQLNSLITDVSDNTNDIAALESSTVKLTGSQVIAGNKQFNDQVFAQSGLTDNGGLRLLNVPTVEQGLDGVVWVDNSGFLRLSP